MPIQSPYRQVFVVVFFLFLSERQIDEDLLQSFVDVVDAELFEAVGFEDFKAVNVEHTNALAACTNVAETVATNCECATSAGTTPKIIHINKISLNTYMISQLLKYSGLNIVSNHLHLAGRTLWNWRAVAVVVVDTGCRRRHLTHTRAFGTGTLRTGTLWPRTFRTRAFG
jgi:hypothetical protein